MKICIVSSIPVFPPHGGNRAHTLSLIRTLQAMQHHVSFILLTSRQMGDFDRSAHEAEFGSGYHELQRSRSGQTLYLLGRSARKLKRRLTSPSEPGLNRYDHIDEIYYRPFNRVIRKLFCDTDPDIVIADCAYFTLSLLMAPVSSLRVVDTHDSFDHEVSAEEERRGLNRADVVFANQNEEAEKFRLSLGTDRDKVRIVSHITETCKALDVSTTSGATFLGSSFRANIISIKFFVEDVLPIILNREPGFILTIAGAICGDVDDHPAIRKLGRVENIADAFTAAPILVHPIRAGTGVKIKLLDAMALGVPPVSTQSGALGIADDHLGGVTVVGDEDAAQFAETVLRLYRDAPFRIDQGSRAREAATRRADEQIEALQEVIVLAERKRAAHRTIAARA